jgi:hypothetical protein
MGGEGRRATGHSYRGVAQIFLQNFHRNTVYYAQPLPRQCNRVYDRRKMFHNLPLAPREIRATEARLEAIYNAAARGLKGDSLALAAGMLPTEYRRLCQFDPLAEMAALKGKADSELKIAGKLHEAAENGDAKAALAILQHRHDWTAKHELSVDVQHRISITDALQAAQGRVLEGKTLPALEHTEPTRLPRTVTPADHAEADL